MRLTNDGQIGNVGEDASSSSSVPSHHFQWTPDSPQHAEVGVNFGLLQLALGGFNVVQDEGTTFLLAGDTSYNERLMLAGRIDGVGADDDVASATLGAIRQLARDRLTVYLPTHDPESAIRLASRRVVDKEMRA